MSIKLFLFIHMQKTFRLVQRKPEEKEVLVNANAVV